MTGQPQSQPMLMDPAAMQGQPEQVGQPDPQQTQVDPAQEQYNYYQQFQPANQQQQQPAQQQQPIAGTPFYTAEQMAEGYKNLQRLEAQRQQQLQELQTRYDQVVNHALTLQQRAQQQPQAQPQATQAPWELPLEQFAEEFNKNPGNVFNTLKSQMAKEIETKAREFVTPLETQVRATQLHLNRTAVTQTFENLQSQYGSIPNYDTLLNNAVNLITTDPVWIKSANENPAAALQTAFQAELGKNLSNPEFLTALGKSAAQQQQQAQMQRQLAQPMTTSGNVQAMPHQPITNNGMPPVQQNAMLAHQIATYTNQEYFNPQGPRYKVQTFNMDY